MRKCLSYAERFCLSGLAVARYLRNGYVSLFQRECSIRTDLYIPEWMIYHNSMLHFLETGNNRGLKLCRNKSVIDLDFLDETMSKGMEHPSIALILINYNLQYKNVVLAQDKRNYNKIKYYMEFLMQEEYYEIAYHLQRALI